REQHAPLREVGLSLEEEENCPDRNVHPDRVHDEGIEQGHFAYKAGRLSEEDTPSRLVHLYLFHPLPSLSGRAVRAPVREEMDHLITSAIAVQSEPKAIRPVQDSRVLDRAVRLVERRSLHLEDRRPR